MLISVTWWWLLKESLWIKLLIGWLFRIFFLFQISQFLCKYAMFFFFFLFGILFFSFKELDNLLYVFPLNQHIACYQSKSFGRAWCWPWNSKKGFKVKEGDHGVVSLGALHSCALHPLWSSGNEPLSPTCSPLRAYLPYPCVLDMRWGGGGGGRRMQ